MKLFTSMVAGIVCLLLFSVTKFCDGADDMSPCETSKFMFVIMYSYFRYCVKSDMNINSGWNRDPHITAVSTIFWIIFTKYLYLFTRAGRERTHNDSCRGAALLCQSGQAFRSQGCIAIVVFRFMFRQNEWQLWGHVRRRAERFRNL